jgi:hypothetical protein
MELLERWGLPASIFVAAPKRSGGDEGGSPRTNATRGSEDGGWCILGSTGIQNGNAMNAAHPVIVGTLALLYAQHYSALEQTNFASSAFAWRASGE